MPYEALHQRELGQPIRARGIRVLLVSAYIHDLLTLARILSYEHKGTVWTKPPDDEELRPI